MLEMLDKQSVKYKTYDVLTEWKLKEWLKFYSNWPNFPQLFINSRFIGGSEIV